MIVAIDNAGRAGTARFPIERGVAILFHLTIEMKRGRAEDFSLRFAINLWKHSIRGREKFGFSFPFS